MPTPPRPIKPRGARSGGPAMLARPLRAWYNPGPPFPTPTRV
jgi:hypothetical protein